MGIEYHARVFRNGHRRAVDIPAEIDLPGEELVFRQEGSVITVAPVERTLSLAEWLITLAALPPEDRMPEIDDPPPESIDL